MSMIPGKSTKPEIIIRKYIHKRGFRYRINDNRYPGKPDIVLPKYRVIIFIHGCFWHGHQNCKRAKLPDTRREFWKAKISNNIIRDKKNTQLLEDMGWTILTIWQCEIGTLANKEKRLEKLIEEIAFTSK